MNYCLEKRDGAGGDGIHGTDTMSEPLRGILALSVQPQGILQILGMAFG